ncbi:MAG: DUF885 family protein [Planctomycetes bacterium]|nr:DUF885 family protein [Planctomycetota bacterium]MCC7170055.1 DUF885 family protein [Planctomycetota bacterium]
MLALAALVALASVSSAEPIAAAQALPAASAPASSGLAALLRAYQVDLRDFDQFNDLRFDPVTWEAKSAFLARWSARLDAIDRAALDLTGKVDHAILALALHNETASIELARRQLAEMDALLPFRELVLALEHERRTLVPIEPEATAARLAPLAASIDALRGELARKHSAGEVVASAVVGRRAAAAVDHLHRVLSEWFAYYEGFDPLATWWLRQPIGEVSRALNEYARFLREDVAGLRGRDDDPLVGDPIGRDALLADLRGELLATTPEQLVAIGEREMQWCEVELKRAARELGFGDDWKAALAATKADHVEPGAQDDLVAEQAKFAIQFLKDRDLVTIPPLCEATWRVEMLSLETQKVLPYAVYNPQAMGVSYPTDAMDHADKEMSLRGNNRHFTRNVTPHELIPGHHLQGFMARRERPERQILSTPFLVEGWALYWEMLFWDIGYPRNAHERIGMLFWRAHRCARILVSLKFHLGEMTPAQMVDTLVDQVGHERFAATSEVRRYIAGDYSPLYQCGYMIGGLQLRQLRAELGTRVTDKQFHDTVLTLGPIPIELIRCTLLGIDPDPDGLARWPVK